MSELRRALIPAAVLAVIGWAYLAVRSACAHLLIQRRHLLLKGACLTLHYPRNCGGTGAPGQQSRRMAARRNARAAFLLSG